MQHLSIVECPRDAWQGISSFIPTEKKVKHIAYLMRCGFHSIDAGSFVSPKAMPQMADADALFTALAPLKEEFGGQLLAIVANDRGAKRAANHSCIDSWGYPFSVSEQFQLRNSRKTIVAAMDDLKRVKDLATKNGKELVVYLSMAFGNPYNEVYSTDLVGERMLQAVSCGADVLSISDTTGQGTVERIAALCQFMGKESPVAWGAHLHSTYEEAGKKAQAAVEQGCLRIDTALKGFGGCPFAADALVGNMPTEKIVTALDQMGQSHGLNMLAVERAYNSALEVFETK